MIEIIKKLLIDSLNKERMTQVKLAREIGISQPAIQKYLYGGNISPRIDTLIKICKYYGLDPNSILNQTNNIFNSITHDPICQEIYLLCEKLPDKAKEQVLRYVKFISQEYNTIEGESFASSYTKEYNRGGNKENKK